MTGTGNHCGWVILHVCRTTIDMWAKVEDSIGALVDIANITTIIYCKLVVVAGLAEVLVVLSLLVRTDASVFLDKDWFTECLIVRTIHINTTRIIMLAFSIFALHVQYSHNAQRNRCDSSQRRRRTFSGLAHYLRPVKNRHLGVLFSSVLGTRKGRFSLSKRCW